MNRTNRLTTQQVNQFNKLSNLKSQFYEDIPNLTSSTQSVISRQATINIGTIGHVSHGKSTVVQAITGVKTGKFWRERKSNKTIRLGYANAKIFKCATCPAPDCYKSYSSDSEDNRKCPNQGCSSDLELIRHVSFCDCPGHDSFMSTMLTGVSIMDSALLLVAANVDCPQPQTAEHLFAIDMMGLNNIIILQNKIDIILTNSNKNYESISFEEHVNVDDTGKIKQKMKDKLKVNYKQIKEFTKDSICKNSPIIPISAQLRYNIDGILQAISEIPIPQRRLTVPPIMAIIRSFDINKPGTQIDNLKGGIVGGTLKEGILEVGMEVQIRPGYLSKNQEGNFVCQPIKTRIVSLEAEKNSLLYAVPGGLIGVGLLLDPSLTRNDQMVGNILGAVGSLPQIYTTITIKFYLLKKLLGVNNGNISTKVKKIEEGQIMKFNISSAETSGKVLKVIDDIIHVQLNIPICTKIYEKVAFSRRFEKKYRLIGYGEIKQGKIITG